MNIAIFGASGFLGKQLIDTIMRSTDWKVLATARNPAKIVTPVHAADRFTIKHGDITNYEETVALLKNIDVAYYFVHMMGHKNIDFYKAELQAARTFQKAMEAAQLPRLIFMGGLGDDLPTQSKHLASRHRTGEILRSTAVRAIELRASMIVGSGSVAFDIISNVARRIPILVLPKTADTRTQPIAVADAVAYLMAAATVPADENIIVDIGGPEILTYAEMYYRYMAYIHKKPLVVKVPVMPAWISGAFLDFLTPKIHARIGQAMVDSMGTEMIVRNDQAQKMFPDIPLHSIEYAFDKADTSIT